MERLVWILNHHGFFSPLLLLYSESLVITNDYFFLLLHLSTFWIHLHFIIYHYTESKSELGISLLNLSYYLDLMITIKIFIISFDKRILSFFSFSFFSSFCLFHHKRLHYLTSYQNHHYQNFCSLILTRELLTNNNNNIS